MQTTAEVGFRLVSQEGRGQQGAATNSFHLRAGTGRCSNGGNCLVLFWSRLFFYKEWNGLSSVRAQGSRRLWSCNFPSRQGWLKQEILSCLANWQLTDIRAQVVSPVFLSKPISFTAGRRGWPSETGPPIRRWSISSSSSFHCQVSVRSAHRHRS